MECITVFFFFFLRLLEIKILLDRVSRKKILKYDEMECVRIRFFILIYTFIEDVE